MEIEAVPASQRLDRVHTTAKYGLLITASIIAWVLFNYAVPLPFWLYTGMFHAFVFAGLAFAIRERRSILGRLTFGEGIRTGLSTAAIYGVTVGLFFATARWVVSTSLWRELIGPWLDDRSTSSEMTVMLVGFFLLAILSGLMFSLLLSAIMRRSTP